MQLAKNIGNAGFNEIMECCLPAEDSVKPNPGIDMYVCGWWVSPTEQRLACPWAIRGRGLTSLGVLVVASLRKKSAYVVYKVSATLLGV